MSTIIWKSLSGIVPGGENYSVSTEGQVRNDITGKLLSPGTTGNGYQKVVLYSQGKRNEYSVHRLVALAFLDNPENKPQVNHIDGNKANNNLNNLEWCTVSENLVHAYAHGLTSTKGNNSRVAKLTEKDVVSIKEMIRDGHRLIDIAKQFGVRKSTISQIKSGRNWSHVKVEGFKEENPNTLHYAKGNNHPQAKLTEDQVSEIRKTYKAGGYSYSALAKQYGVSAATISDIVNYRIWKHVI